MDLAKLLNMRGSAPSAIDEAAYEYIAFELSNNSVKQGLWTKALADSDWDEAKAKSYYVKMRHEQLIDEINKFSKEKQKEEVRVDKRIEAAYAEAIHYGLSKDEIEYLGIPILAIKYVEKYRKSKEKVSQAIAKKKLSAVMKNENLWVSDKPI